MAIPIIDLFAGPGGLGEGFTSVVKNGKRVFKIALSIEKDPFAHQTLTLRSFLRQFPAKNFPKEYYEFLESKKKDVELLFAKYPKEALKAQEEAWLFELGRDENYEILDERIRRALDGEKKFILIGGPPCQAYSLVGRSRRQETTSLNKNDLRVYLYREYYRILAVHNPPVFVMENVKGLLSSKVGNELIFNQLIKDLSDPVDSYKKLLGRKRLSYQCPGYKIYSLVRKANVNLNDEEYFRPEDFVIRAEEYGVPQTRHRVILLGIRNDVSITPETLKKAPYHISVDEVLNGLPKLRSGLSKSIDSKEAWREEIQQIVKSGIEKEVDNQVWRQIVRTIEIMKAPRWDRGGDFIGTEVTIDYNKEWFLDNRLKGITNHETRSHIKEDLFRYLFAASFARIHRRSPKLEDFPKVLLPRHKNISDSRKFNDRFRVQTSGIPSKTITSHISKDGHYYIHHDPFQCRSLTVREAARIQTFPDNYYFCGPRTEQYHQVGNAVPPFLAKQIATLIHKIIPS